MFVFKCQFQSVFCSTALKHTFLNGRYTRVYLKVSFYNTVCKRPVHLRAESEMFGRFIDTATVRSVVHVRKANRASAGLRQNTPGTDYRTPTLSRVPRTTPVRLRARSFPGRLSSNASFLLRLPPQTPPSFYASHRRTAVDKSFAIFSRANSSQTYNLNPLLSQRTSLSCLGPDRRWRNKVTAGRGCV